MLQGIYNSKANIKWSTWLLNDHSQRTLGSLITDARKRAHLSARQLAERVGTAHSQINRIESGAIANPKPWLVARIAEELDLRQADLFAAVGWQNPAELQGFTPYLRRRYRRLPAAAQEELRRSLDVIARKYGYDADGPALGEDESDHPITK